MTTIRFFQKTLPRRILGILLTLVLLLGLIVGGLYLLDPYGFKIAPGVTIGQLDVSGKTLPGALRLLQEALEDTLYQQTLTVHLPEQDLLLSPADTKPAADVWQAALDAYAVGRWKDTEPSQLGLQEYLTVDEAAVRACLLGYATNHDTRLTESTWTLEGEAPALSTQRFDPTAPCQELTVTLGYPEAKLDVDAAWADIWDAFCDSIAACQAGAYAVTVEVAPSALPQELDAAAISQSISVEAVSDSLSLETHSLVPGSYGYTFDTEKLQQLLSTADYGTTVTVPMEYVAPQLLGEDVYFRDVLGACETRHTNNENRNTNLRLLCQALDGVILQPGEEFSYNETVGERTREKGYKPAPAYSGNRLVDSVGGGVCQGSTTLYNCVLLADLEVVFRVCHGASVGYVPLGLDAAVNWLTTDFQFRNNWDFPIQIRAQVSDGYVKMQILGTDQKDYYIKMQSSSWDDEVAVYARSYKCKYSKATDELLSREVEAFSTYYKNIG